MAQLAPKVRVAGHANGPAEDRRGTSVRALTVRLTGTMGFAGVPGSAVLLAGATMSPMIISFLGIPFRLQLRMDPQILRWHQYYRFATNSVMWTDQASVLIAALTLYNLRVVERFFGPVRFRKVALGAWAASTALSGLAAWSLYSLFDVNLVFQPGAIGLVAALLGWYVQLVPPTYYVKIGYATFSDKVVTYMLFALLLRDWGDIIKATTGLAAKVLVSLLI